MSVIVAISGGKASAWCATWALENYNPSDVILYFNDTKWEHPDLYRFMNELSKFLGRPIIEDSDGRSPEQLFIEHHALANNRMPFCSMILKAERLQRFYKDGDILVFGIGSEEMGRASRIIAVYQRIAVKTNRYARIELPLITEQISSRDIDSKITQMGIEPPALYGIGFIHNNCSGGCVRAGKKQWKLLYEKLPSVYAERERVENYMRGITQKDIHFFKDETLKHFRWRIETGNLSKHYLENEDIVEHECIGICESIN